MPREMHTVKVTYMQSLTCETFAVQEITTMLCQALPLMQSRASFILLFNEEEKKKTYRTKQF